MKKVLLILLAAPQLLIAQTTLIPDANFEQKLVALGIDNVVNGSVLTASAAAVTDLDVSASNISNLTGIEAFTSLTYLNCGDNHLSNLNVTPILTLQELECYGNTLTTLNLTANTSLHYLDAYSNQISSLDVTHNPGLQYLGLDENNLTSLNVTLNTNLQELHVGSNLLTSIDISHNAALTQLVAYGNNLSSINISANPALEVLKLGLNQITSIDLTHAVNLKELRINNNLLTTLSIAQSPLLTQINCQGNRLTSLDLRNGNNINFILTNNGAQFNQGLSCISVDNPAYSSTNWGINFHETATYSANCLLSTDSPLLQMIAIYPNPSNGKIFINTPDLIKIDTITVSDLNGRIIKQVKPNGISEQTELDLTGVNQGVYFASIESDKGKLNTKIILK
ncbi:hypothetical protein FEDK69T_26810 [Flavobacterium enshiense DK69]|uniref:Secretion system C-terminal sorting domain-containing protein n=1 Tax=Flavobacterium enshiense DK69 TaxID=1107311 RepID=V6S3Y3_9FLAO|nr:T9SS type A sorting domain-containing protein [Flavobacterium enshiense]ESU21124.1 hypothetical protein FEDK69T_26810 [Flavobacterium enshiense DK69]KGO95266.1 hypothetical protein Q767_12460 [Flavobacterium enshiense DK69]